MTNYTDKTVAAIAIENPSSIPVFESLGIDFCCGGNRPLTDACAAKGVPVERVLELLANATDRTPAGVSDRRWDAVPTSELIDHIENSHHVYIRTEVPNINALAAKVASRHGANHPETIEIREEFDALGRELLDHLLKEEHILFPYVREIEASGSSPTGSCFGGQIARPLSVMHAEHDSAGSSLERLAKLTGNYTPPADACVSFRALYEALRLFALDLHQHIHLENNLLFPKAIQLEQAAAQTLQGR